MAMSIWLISYDRTPTCSRRGIANLLPERRNRSHPWQAPNQPIRHISLPRTRSISWQGLRSRVRLVVVGCPLLRMHLQQGMTCRRSFQLLKLIPVQRPFEGHHHDQLIQAIVKGEPNFPVTNPPVSMVCMHAISSLLEKDKTQRIGASSWNSFTDNPFFRELDFEALERKEIEPIFKPSSEKTNFDATYDLEELLLEEAPLEARTRKQKPRPELRADATEAEIRADELHRMIETMFEPFNYLTVPETRCDSSSTSLSAPPRLIDPRNPVALDGDSPQTTKSDNNDQHTPQDLHKVRSIPTPHSSTPNNVSRTRSSTQSPNGSPPLPTHHVQNTSAAQQEYFAQQQQQQQQQQRMPRSVRYDETHPPPAPPAPPTSHPQQAVNKAHRPRGSTRSTSMSGGVQVVLNETGSWSEMANQSQTLVQPQEDRKPAGMLGFLSRKKGRDRSPKAKERERGVLGKEGARVVVGS